MSAQLPRTVRRREVPPFAGGDALPPVLQRIYAARGVASTADVRPPLQRLLRIGSLDNVEAAAALLHAHLGGRVIVVGDYDADGATSTALLLRALRAWGFAHVDFIVPDRFRFGYGLTPEIVELAAERAPTLLVTVDNGIASVAGVARARERGIAVLVTDHHLPGAELPSADVIVNPNVPGSGFGSRALAGVGVAFYVACALHHRLAAAGSLPAGAPRPAAFLDLVALGTVADLVPLDANNRILVREGLAHIRAGRGVPGIAALLAIAEREPGSITAADLGFTVAPRLNAAGRLDDMGIGIRCLLADDAATARQFAEQLDDLNRERRRIEADMQAIAVAAVRGIDAAGARRRHGLCIYDAAWHQGVVGLVASRIKDRVRRPVVAFARGGDEGQLRGSARSVPGVHIRDVFDAVASREPGLLEKFGGHAMAAGLTLREENLDRFAAAFDAEVARWTGGIGDDDVLLTDGELGADELGLATAELLREHGPWGQAFPEPCFDGVFDVTDARLVGERHAKLWVRPAGTTARFDAIAFNWRDAGADARGLPQGRVRLVYRLDVNVWRGERRLQLLVDDLAPLPAAS